MKALFFTLFLLLGFTSADAITCYDLKKKVEKEGKRSKTFSNNNLGNDFIQSLTFYEFAVSDTETYHFAVVRFKINTKNGQLSGKEYLYQVDDDTERIYGLKQLDDPERAFMEYIQFYNSNLGCAPDISYY